MRVALSLGRELAPLRVVLRLRDWLNSSRGPSESREAPLPVGDFGLNRETKMYLRLLAATLVVASVSSFSGSASAEDEVMPLDLNDEYERASRRAARGDVSSAVTIFKEIAAQDPYWSDVFYNVGSLSEHRSSWQDCALYFRRYLILEPDDSDLDDIQRSIDRCEAAMPAGGTLAVSGTDPEGSRVMLDGLALGDGGFGPVRLSPGTYVVTASRTDYFDFTEAVEITDGGSNEVFVTLQPIPQYGTVSFSVVQDGARILIDGVERGVTPLTEPLRLEVGNYSVEILGEGYHPWRRNIDILRELDDEIDVRLIDESVDLSQYGR